MRVVVCAQAVSPSLGAQAAAAAVRDGWRAVRPHDEIRVIPLSAGGSGLLSVLEESLVDAKRRPAEVADARGYATDAHWLQLPDGTAVIESALACGLDRLPADQHNLRKATTYGVGQLVLAAVAAGAPSIVVGVGDSAAADGGAGLATALGHRLLREDGNRVKVGAQFLDQVERVVPRQPLSVPITVIYDMEIPLLRPTGAVRQEPDPAAAALIEDNLRHFADIVERDLAGGPWRQLPGVGAGGGMAFGLAAFAGATLLSARKWFAQIVDLPGRCAGADLVIAAAADETWLSSAAGAARAAGTRWADLGQDRDADGLTAAAQQLAREVG